MWAKCREIRKNRQYPGVRKGEGDGGIGRKKEGGTGHHSCRQRGLSGEGCLTVGMTWSVSALCTEGPGKRNALSSLVSLPPSSCRCFPLSKPNQCQRAREPLDRTTDVTKGLAEVRDKPWRGK